MDKKRGKIRKYIDHAGYGFIVPDTGGSDVFFHLSGCEQGYEPREGDAVSFNLQERPDRRYRAVNVERLRGRTASEFLSGSGQN